MILVTGATGFVGAEILRRASRRGWRVRGMARRPDRAGELGRLPHVELFRGDVTEPDDLDEAMEDVDAVIHLVGIIAPTKRQTMEAVHVGGTRNVLAAAARAGVRRHVHMSALGVERARELTEYFRTKRAAEEAVRESGLSATIFRPSIVFGIEGELIAQLSRAVRWSPVIPLPAGGRSILQPVWIGDVAECFLQAARMEATPRPVYDVVGPEVLTLAEVTRTLARAMGRRPRPVVPVPMGLARLAAGIVETLWPGTPPVTVDQLKMLGIENVSDEEGERALARDFELERPRLADVAPEWFGRRGE